MDLQLLAWARIYPEVTETFKADCSVQEKEIVKGFQSLIGDRLNLTEFGNSQAGGILRNVTSSLGEGLKNLF